MSNQGQVPAAGSRYHNCNENAMQLLTISSRPVDIDPYQVNDGEGIGFGSGFSQCMKYTRFNEK